MGVIETRAAIAATELSTVSGGSAIPPNIMALLMQFLTSLLAGCVPAVKASRRVARGGKLFKRAVMMKAAELFPEVGCELVFAAVTDQAETLTPSEWELAYSEAAAAKQVKPK